TVLNTVCSVAYPILSVSLGVEVHQSPSDFITKPGEEVQIFCSHDKTDFRLMLWYQRSPGETAMKLIGYLHYNTLSMEEQYKDNFNITGDLSGNKKKNESLKIQVVGPEQGAVYYCAASKAQ
uniref:Ig-like domain-containing protein n=1 Tax=Amphiprion ocellaris TaxID=80972 RepID=A0AAQ5Y1P2_AMPOC